MKSHPLKTLYYPDIPTGLLEAYEHGVLEVLELEEARIVGHANELKFAFMQAKMDLYQSAKAATDNQGKGIYSPLALVTRYHKGSLSILWQEIHFKPNRAGGKTKYYRQIRKVAEGYQIPKLRSRATYDVELVEDFELRARELRKYWSQLMELKKAVRIALSKLPPGVAAALAEKNASSVNRLIPRSQENSGPPETSGTV